MRIHVSQIHLRAPRTAKSPTEYINTIQVDLANQKKAPQEILQSVHDSESLILARRLLLFTLVLHMEGSDDIFTKPDDNEAWDDDPDTASMPISIFV